MHLIRIEFQLYALNIRKRICHQSIRINHVICIFIVTNDSRSGLAGRLARGHICAPRTARPVQGRTRCVEATRFKSLFIFSVAVVVFVVGLFVNPENVDLSFLLSSV